LGLKLYNTLLVIYRTLSNIAIETAYPLYQSLYKYVMCCVLRF